LPYPLKLQLFLVNVENDFYIVVKNKEISIDINRIVCHTDFFDKENNRIIQSSIKWVDGKNNHTEDEIRRKIYKLIQFATIDPLNNKYYIHLVDEELELPFLNNRVYDLWIFGHTSAPYYQTTKNQINYHLLFHEYVIDEKLVLKLENVW
jgi:predicted phosphodiesterase